MNIKEWLIQIIEFLFNIIIMKIIKNGFENFKNTNTNINGLNEFK